MSRLPSILLCCCLAAPPLLYGQAAAAATEQGQRERAGIRQALSEIRSQYGGHKLNQSWQRDQLLLVWQARDGRRLLLRIDPASGRWRQQSHARPDR